VIDELILCDVYFFGDANHGICASKGTDGGGGRGLLSAIGWFFPARVAPRKLFAIAFILVAREKHFSTSAATSCAHFPPKVRDGLVKLFTGLTGDTDHHKGLPLGVGHVFQA